MEILSEHLTLNWQEKHFHIQELFSMSFFFSLIPISYAPSARLPSLYSAVSAAFPDFFALLRSARFFFVSSFFCST